MARSEKQEIKATTNSNVDPKNRLHDILNPKTSKSAFVLESLSFNSFIATKDSNSNAVKSKQSNYGKDARIFRCSEKSLFEPTANGNDTSPSDNSDVQVQLLSNDSSHSDLIIRPPFVLESLSFSPSFVNATSCDASQTDLHGNENRNKHDETISTQDTSIRGNGKYSQTSMPIRRPFFVLESLSYKESGILRVISKNTSEGKSYEILPAKNKMASKQSNETIRIIARKQNISTSSVFEANVPDRPSGKYKNGPCSDIPGGKMWYKQAHLSSREQNEAINKCLLLETDPVHFKLLKTVRQPYVVLEKLSN